MDPTPTPMIILINEIDKNLLLLDPLIKSPFKKALEGVRQSAVNLLDTEKAFFIEHHLNVMEQGLEDEGSEYVGKAKEIFAETASKYYSKTFEP